MRKILLLFLFWLTLVLQTKAQLGNQWMLGWIGKADFSSGAMQYILYPDTISMLQTNAGICDSSGQILLWTNGSEVFRANRTIIGSVPHLPFSQGYVQTGLGLNMYQGSILLPDPGNPFEYYLFYGSGDTYNTTGYPPMHTNVHLRYSKINVVANAGQGAIVINGVDVEDSLQYGHLTAVRHANGRDWWVISHKLMSDQYVSWLVTPSGVSNTIRQSIGFNIWNKEKIGTITSSAQGDKIAIMIADEVTGPNVLKRLEVMDFDRCTGQLSNLNSASFQDTMNVPAPCAEFSPSGRYVYVTTTFFIYQFDTQNSSLQNSQILLDTFNGTFAPFAAYFYGLARAPDGKMYCHSYNGN